MRALDRRIARCEARADAQGATAPHVLSVGPEGRADALAAFASAYPHRSRNHGLLVVPAKATDADDFATRFKASQMALVRAARAEPIVPSVVASDAEPATERASINRAREVVAAAKVPVTKPTYSAANRLSHAERARLHGRARLSN